MTDLRKDWEKIAKTGVEDAVAADVVKGAYDVDAKATYKIKIHSTVAAKAIRLECENIHTKPEVYLQRIVDRHLEKLIFERMQSVGKALMHQHKICKTTEQWIEELNQLQQLAKLL